MGRPSKLTPEQWAIARRRWEGSDKDGFAWLREEVLAEYGHAPTRPAIQQMAVRAGWSKNGKPLQASRRTATASLGYVVSQVNCEAARRQVRRATQPPVAAGVYFLLRGATIVYIGQSVDVFSRVRQHRSEQAKLFDSAAFLPCDPALLDALESALIHLFRPHLNRRNASMAMVAPIPMRPIVLSPEVAP